MDATRCPRCQASLPADAGAFCGHWGQRLVLAAAVLAPAPASSAPVPPAEPSPAVTQRWEPAALALAAPPSSGAPAADTVRMASPAAAVSTRPRPAAPLQGEDDEFAPQRGSRLLNMMAVALAAAALGTGGGIYLYRRWQTPPVAPLPASETVADSASPPGPPRVAPPVVTETAARVPEPAISGGPDRKRTRPAVAAAEPVRGTGGKPGRPAPAPSPPPPVGKTAPVPVSPQERAAAPAGKTPVVAAAPPAPAPPNPGPTAPPASAAAPKPAPPAPVVLPSDEGESTPFDEEALAEQRQGEIMAEGIFFVVKTHRTQWRGCYERAFKNETTLPTVRVEIEFTIDREGRARHIKTVSSNTDNTQLASCLEHLLAQWQFPRPPAGEFATSYPFVIAGG